MAVYQEYLTSGTELTLAASLVKLLKQESIKIDKT